MLERQIAIAIGTGLLVGACGGSVSNPPQETSQPETTNTSTSFIALLSTEPGLCMPQALTRDDSGLVTCKIIEALAHAHDACAFHPGRIDVDEALASSFRTAESVDPTLPICEVTQIFTAPGSTCERDSSAGWCYIDSKAAAPTCAQAVRFTQTGEPGTGTLVGIACSR